VPFSHDLLCWQALRTGFYRSLRSAEPEIVAPAAINQALQMACRWFSVSLISNAAACEVAAGSEVVGGVSSRVRGGNKGVL